MKVGSKVRFLLNIKDKRNRFPKRGTIGVVTKVMPEMESIKVRWPKGTTAMPGEWVVNKHTVSEVFE